MGRNKKYEREDIARKAMALFWRDGFYGTSTQALVESMGVNRFSLYAEFENKQNLYEAALSLYAKEVVDQHFRALESEDAGLAQIKAMFESFAASAGEPGTELGCFMCNCATERGADDPRSQLFVHQHVARISAAFSNALSHAQRDGAIGSSVQTVQEGQFLATLLLGFFVLLRAKVDPAVVRASATTVLSHVQQLQISSKAQGECAAE
jgi:TetR/AcrR family transcriptional repressor of nem operon